MTWSGVEYARGRLEERERLVRLLSQLRCAEFHDCGGWHDHYHYGPDELVELVRGETH